MDIGEPWTDVTRTLWSRLQAHRFERPELRLDFIARLAREHGWSRADALAAVEEYRRFCFLAVAAGHHVTPGLDVDEVWHLHLTDSRDYWETFCPRVLQCALHHEPTRGAPGDARRHYAQYAQTLASYQRWFGPPPARFWPPAAQQFAHPARWRRVDLTRVRVRPRWRLRLPRAWRVACALPLLATAPRVFAAAVPMVVPDGSPLDWAGPKFLALFVLLLFMALAAAVMLRRRLRDNGSPVPTVPPSTAEIAYLAGGAERVVDSSVAELLAREDVRWDAAEQRVRGITRQLRDTPFPLDLVAQKILDDTPIPKIARLLGPALDPLRTALERRGLLLAPSQALRARLVPALLPLGIGAFGVIKIWIGLARDRPVGFLVILCILAGIAALVLARRPARTSLAGARLLRRLGIRHAHATRAPRDADIGLAVAIAGTAVLSGTAFAAYHDHRVPPSGSSGSDGDSSGSSSSDSGGSDGGGGCGGCGGGGD